MRELNTNPFFKHDYNAAEDPKVEALRDAYGAEGYAVFFLTLEYLYRQEGKALSPLGVRSVAGKLRLDKARVTEILDFMSSDECEHLIEKCPSGYYSNRVIMSFKEAADEYEALKRKKSEAGKKSGEARRNRHEQE